MFKQQLDEMELWDIVTKRYFTKHFDDWHKKNNWSRKVAFKEAYKETVIYLLRNEKVRKYKKKKND